MKRKTVSGIMLILLLIGMLILAFNIQPVTAEPETARVDNLIITSSDLEAAATRLAQWKNSCGIPSKVLNVTWIYSHYSGVDEPEKIRNCIIDFHSNFQTRYVTIFGDVDKVPIRYAYIPDEEAGETYVPTDLYYADLDYTWDDNGDGKYADLDNDLVDGIPDVYVGRIPPSFIDTAEDVVTKIIEYQQNFDVSEDWVNRVVLAAGLDGGTTTAISDYISDIVSDKNVVKLYEPAGNLTNHALDDDIDRGCILLNFAGHSGKQLWEFWSPEYWVLSWRIWPLEVWKYTWQDALDRTNGRKLPVIVTMSCLSAQVDEGTGECIAEYFVLNPDGGAIAYFGSTRVAWCYGNCSAPYGLMGEMDRRIFEAFYEGHTRLGDMWGVALTEYLQVDGYHQLDRYFNYTWGTGYLNEKTVMEFILLGDPTLRIYNGPETLEVPEDYATIQGAINSAYDGDTIFVRSGTYYENAVVNKSVSLLGESRENTIIDGQWGVLIDANDVTLKEFTIHNASESAGITVAMHSNSTIRNNVLTGNNFGIWLYESSNNSIYGNNITNNLVGIWLWHSSNNVISRNNITSNNVYGISLGSSSNNKFYHNNFVNIFEVYSPSSTNVWDNGYPSGGNYWSEYAGVDVKSGANQDQPSSDAIGDTAYVIDTNNTDHYPLMYPWGAPPPPSYTLAIYSAPTGITFTVSDVSRTARWSGTYSEGSSVSLVMPEIHTVGDTRYYWSQWSDGNTSRARTVTMTANITLTAYYAGPYYELTVTSSPIAGITYTINGSERMTPHTEMLLEGYYTLEMPQTHNGYVWSHWLEDGDTNRIKTITLSDTTYTAVYSPIPTPVGGIVVPIDKFSLLAPYVGLTLLLAVAVMTIGYVKKRKRNRD